MNQISFLPLLIFDSYVSLVQKKIVFCTSRRISDPRNLAVASWYIRPVIIFVLFRVLFPVPQIVPK